MKVGDRLIMAKRLPEKRLSIKSQYKLKSKYKIIKFQNGLGETWCKIQIQGWFFNRWFKCWYNTDYGWTPFIPSFGSEEEAEEFLRKEHYEQVKNNLRNNIQIIRGTNCEL